MERNAFPFFLRNEANRAVTDDVTSAMEGYVYEGADGTQLVLWTNKSGQGYSAPHKHDYEEYCIVLSGRFTGLVDGKPVSVGPGEELCIPAGVVHEGGYTKGYRAIDGFGGRRVKRKEDGR